MASEANKTAAVRKYLTTHPKATPINVVKALKSLDVRPKMVVEIKAEMAQADSASGSAASGKPSRKNATANPAKAKSTAAKRSSGTRRKVNKTEIVRQYMADHPEAGPSDISKALKALNVSPNYVSNIKLKMKSGKPLKKRGRPRKQNVGAARSNSSEAVISAAKLIGACGSTEAAREALQVAAKIIGAAS